MDIMDVANVLDQYLRFGDPEPEFIEANDIGFALATLMVLEAAMPMAAGAWYLRETWVSFCAMLDIDPNGVYASWDQIEGEL